MISVRDQSSFLDQAKPPTGYRLTYCVGTTFSLDLECLLQMALNCNGIEGSLRESEEMSAFVALRDFQAKALVFCQNCRIKELREHSEETRSQQDIRRLFAALDSSVVAVPAPSLKAAFHPKVWLFRYDSAMGSAPPTFTLCVMSRNLTASRDWDISAIFTGSHTRIKRTKNQRIIEFFSRLQKHTQCGQKRNLLQRAMRDLPHVHFNAIPALSRYWEFLFNWTVQPKWALIDPLRYRELIAVSPFLGKTINTLQALNSVSKFTLITGPKDIATVKRVNGLVHRTYVMDGTSESAWDTAGVDPGQLGLHAKIYLGLQKHSNDVDVFIGSANLTDSGFRRRNIEAMVLLKCDISRFRAFEREFIYKDRVKEILHPWLQSLEAMITSQGETETKDDPTEMLLEDLRGQISLGGFYIRFLKHHQQAVLRFIAKTPVRLPRGILARFQLATSANTFPLEPVLQGEPKIFQAFPDERTEFLMLRLAHAGHELRFITIANSDLNRSARSHAALNRQVKDADSFFRFLGLMLGVAPSTIQSAPTTSKESVKRSHKIHKLAQRFLAGREAWLEPLLLQGLMDIQREEEIEEAIQAFIKARHSLVQKKIVKKFAEFWARYRRASREIRRCE